MKTSTLTTENGKTNKTWLKNRIANGTLVVFEKNENSRSDTSYQPITVAKAIDLLKGMRVWESFNKVIMGSFGASYYYQFKIDDYGVAAESSKQPTHAL